MISPVSAIQKASSVGARLSQGNVTSVKGWKGQALIKDRVDYEITAEEAQRLQAVGPRENMIMQRQYLKVVEVEGTPRQDPRSSMTDRETS